MIGTSSFWLELVGVAGPALMFLVLLVAGRKQRAVWLALPFLALMVGLMGVRYFHQCQARAFLQGVEATAEIRVDGRQVPTTPEVVEALRDIRWFSANHGGWNRFVPLEIRLPDGRTRTFGAALYTREPGAVLEFTRRGGLGYWHDGYAFSPGLPAALRAAGAGLPETEGR